LKVDGFFAARGFATLYDKAQNGNIAVNGDAFFA
jgi:hypothetical protein